MNKEFSTFKEHKLHRFRLWKQKNLNILIQATGEDDDSRLTIDYYIEDLEDRLDRQEDIVKKSKSYHQRLMSKNKELTKSSTEITKLKKQIKTLEDKINSYKFNDGYV